MRGQGPTVLAVGAGGGCLDTFLLSFISLFFLPFSLGGGGHRLKILCERAVKLKTPNQQNAPVRFCFTLQSFLVRVLHILKKKDKKNFSHADTTEA